MEHPGVLCVCKLVRQPLRLQQIEAILTQVKRLAASAIEVNIQISIYQEIYIYKVNLLEIAILFVKVVQIERAPETGASAAYDNDVGGGDHQEDADAAAARECVLYRERERERYM